MLAYGAAFQSMTIIPHRLEKENDLSPSKAHREMSTDLWHFDLTTNVLMHYFFIYL